MLEITVSGVPKIGANCLKSLDEFQDNFVFKSSITNKKTLIYLDEMNEIDLIDYQGNVEHLTNKFGICMLPASYTLGKSKEYADLIDDSSKRAIFGGDKNGFCL